MPFFRAHGHIDTKRREPYLLDDPYKSMLRDILRLRYSMLPIWYTAFREASVTGIPVLRSVYIHSVQSLRSDTIILDRIMSCFPKMKGASASMNNSLLAVPVYW